MMKLYPSIIIYSIVICFSISIIMSSNNWFYSWMGFELSMFGFLPLFTMNTPTTESMIKYFLVQASGSVMFLMSFLIVELNFKFMIMLSMCMKLGIFPFFQWMPMIMSTLSWIGCMILTTIQKISPLMILFLHFNTEMLLLFGVSGIFFSSMLGIQQTNMRPLMAYSSISHTSWISLTIPLNMKMFLMYLSIYILITIMLFYFFSKNNTNSIYMNNMSKKNIQSQMWLMLILVGIPPFSMFFMKMNILFLLLAYPILLMILIISTYMSTYYYISFVIPMILEKKNNKDNKYMLLLSINVIPFFINL